MNQASARLCSVISAESLIVTGEEGGQVKNKWLRIKYTSNTFMLPTQQGFFLQKSLSVDYKHCSIDYPDYKKEASH